MNKQRRKDIAEALKVLAAARGKMEEAASDLATAKDMLEMAQSEEQDYYDNMPENMQGGDKGSTAEQAASDLENAVSETDSAADTLQEHIDAIEGDISSNLDEAEMSADSATSG